MSSPDTLTSTWHSEWVWVTSERSIFSKATRPNLPWKTRWAIDIRFLRSLEAILLSATMKDYRGVYLFLDPGDLSMVQQHLAGHYRARMTERLPRLSQPPRSSEKPFYKAWRSFP
ncbi:hypothetical protein D3C86_1619390 [compost metagenome]